jgi:hypothetical protein
LLEDATAQYDGFSAQRQRKADALRRPCSETSELSKNVSKYVYVIA